MTKVPGSRGWVALLGMAGGLLAAALPARAALVIEIQAYIDGRDMLHLSDNLLEWHHLDWDAVGRTDGGDEPTIISTWLDGVPVMEAVEWTPQWSAPPPDPIFDEEYSVPFTGFDPVFPSSNVDVTLEVLAGREVLAIDLLPSASNGYTLVLDFDDRVTPAAAWYHARITIVPEPAAGIALAVGALAVAVGVRRRRQARR